MNNSAPIDEEIEKNPKRRLLELLRILASFYSFRKLEEKLGIPMQTLWKYYMLKTIPEKQTAIKILQKIKDAGILDEIVREISYEITDPISILSNRGILELAAYKASEIARQNNITDIISLPDSYSATIAFLASLYTRNNVCLADPSYIESDSICMVLKEAYRARPLCISRRCLSRKNKVLLIESIYVPGSIQAIHTFLQKNRAHLTCAYIVYGDPVEIKEDIKQIAEKPHVEVLITKKHIPSKTK
ncbi:hypothetical protein Smar_0502 [Staphylothermus marinus F1]|uniref:Uncharacterized protein n=1 Tax=Staphylothermus marinus (strain ATCC 43588 / DSM 3639 / JCM 9404 / F1) TaxID=399550 RepID=A3DLV0_STAMF|nr:hypothetical protein [Staphylothermus marinus]ABN69610.1 hypothetical protein Smar_0502 [Staphylothermus marinus F1]